MLYVIILLWTLGALGMAMTSPVARDDGYFGQVETFDVLMVVGWPVACVIGICVLAYEVITVELF